MYNEELQHQVLQRIVDAGFPIGRMVDTPRDTRFFERNITVHTNGGPSWYGDMDKSLYDYLNKLASDLGEDIYAVCYVGSLVKYESFPDKTSPTAV